MSEKRPGGRASRPPTPGPVVKPPYVPVNFNQRLPLAERGMVESVCQRCGETFLRMRQGRLRESHRLLACPKCIWIIRKKCLKVIENGEAKRERKDLPSAKQGPWPVRCLRCDWTGVVSNKFSAWVCGKNPAHPVVVDGQK